MFKDTIGIKDEPAYNNKLWTEQTAICWTILRHSGARSLPLPHRAQSDQVRALRATMQYD